MLHQNTAYIPSASHAMANQNNLQHITQPQLPGDMQTKQVLCFESILRHMQHHVAL
jgi:hypothetical protein